MEQPLRSTLDTMGNLQPVLPLERDQQGGAEWDQGESDSRNLVFSDSY